MANIATSFRGRQIILPGVYTGVNAEAMVPERGVPARALCIIAEGKGGEVGAVTRITSPSQVQPKLVGGPLREMVELALAPSGEVQGNSNIYAIRVNNATAASLNLGDATITARNAGRVGLGIRVKRVDNPDGGVNLFVNHDSLRLEEIYRGLGPVLRVKYLGIAATPAITVGESGGVTTVTLSDEDVSINITSDQASSIEALKTAINNTGLWEAADAGGLGAVETTDLEEGALTLESGRGLLSIGPRALELALEGSQIVTAEAGTDAPADITSFTYLDGGDEGPAVTVADYVAAIALAESLELHSFVVGTGDLAVLSAARAHAIAFSDAKNRKERFLYCGPAKAASKTDLMTKLTGMAPGLGHQRVRIAGSEPVLIDAQTSKRKTYPAFYFAAMLAGIKSGNIPALPTTNKQVSIFGTSYSWSPEEQEILIQAGVTPIRYDEPTSSYKIVQGITSYTADANVIYRKDAGMDIADSLQKGLRIRLERYIGKIGDEISVTRILNSTVAFLDEQVRTSTNREGVLTPGQDILTGDDKPAYQNVEVIMDGFDLVGVRFECNPVGEIAYVTATAYLTPVRIVASV